MKTHELDEPELEFGSGGKHVDIRFGIMNSGPLDVDDERYRSLSVGVVGTPETVEKLCQWLDRCRDEIPGKDGNYPNLFPRFPGFNNEVAFRSRLDLDARLQRTLPVKSLVKFTAGAASNELIEDCTGLFISELRYLVERQRPRVLICAPPEELWENFNSRPESSDERSSAGSRDAPTRYDFHDILKARGTELGVPLQLVWPYTYDSTKQRRQRRRLELLRGQQDEATRAWNLHTALYYKSGATPWRLVRDSTQLATCCVGISFYNAIDRTRVLTSMAQVFNERGEGVIVRGSSVKLSKDDLQPHLDEEGAENLLSGGLATYRREHGHLPARVVVHKTSRFNEPELTSFRAAVAKAGIEYADFVSIDEDCAIRLFREGYFPPLRGMFLSMDQENHLLYTRGSVDFFRVYPGQYVPAPLLFRCEDVESTPRQIATEILELTKLNWNTTQFDGRLPITLRAARQVGAILKYVDEGMSIEPNYAYYM